MGLRALACWLVIAAPSAQALQAGWRPPSRIQLERAGKPVALVREGTLEGWTELGDALWTVEGSAIRGRVGGGAQSFLRTDATFGDFVLELELRLHGPGNSGIQVRSSLGERGSVQGYQIEIDPSPRAWSGGLYDEGRRGWLQDLKDLPAARAAFDAQGWNHFRIECVGPWIRSWVNGVPAADHFDPLDLEGFIALQVHSGRDADLTWRELRLWDRGRRAWEDLRPVDLLSSWSATGAGWSFEDDRLLALVRGEPARLQSPAGAADWADFALRFEVRTEGDARLRLLFRHADPSAAGRAPSRGRAPGLSSSDLGWILDTSDPALEVPQRGADADGWRRLALCVQGERIVLHAAGRLVADLRRAPAPPGSLLALELLGTGGGVEVRRFQRVGRPR